VAHAYLGDALLERGRGAEAVAELEEALRLSPSYLEVANNLAWLLATAPDPGLRDPGRALEVAEQALAIADAPPGLEPQERPAAPDTPAAAQAAAGRFEDAVGTAALGLELADRSGDAELAAELRARLALYRSRIPFVER